MNFLFTFLLIIAATVSADNKFRLRATVKEQRNAEAKCRAQCADEMVGGAKSTFKNMLAKDFDFEAYVALGGHRKNDCKNDCIDDNCPSSLDTSSADDCKSDCNDCCSDGDDCNSDSFDKKYGSDDDDDGGDDDDDEGDDDDDGGDDDDDDSKKSKKSKTESSMDNKARCRQKCEKDGKTGDDLFDCKSQCDETSGDNPSGDNPSADIMCFTKCMAASPF